MRSSIAYAETIDSFIFKLNEKIINPLIELSFIIALVLFLYGVMLFIQGANNKDKRDKGKRHMLWGIVGFLIMFGVFSIITILTQTFGISGVTVNQKEQKFNPPPIQEIKIPQ